QGHYGGQVARYIQRQDLCAAQRAKDQRLSIEPEHPAFRRCQGEHQAATRDLGRRRKVLTRMYYRPDRRRGDVLPHDARYSQGDSPGDAAVCFCRGDYRRRSFACCAKIPGAARESAPAAKRPLTSNHGLTRNLVNRYKEDQGGVSRAFTKSERTG